MQSENLWHRRHPWAVFTWWCIMGKRPPGRPDDKRFCNDHPSCTNLFSPITAFLFVSTCCCVAKWLFCIICNSLCAQKEMICASPTQMFDSTEDCEPFEKKSHVTMLDSCAAASFMLFCWNTRNDEWPSFFFISNCKFWYHRHETIVWHAWAYICKISNMYVLLSSCVSLIGNWH